MLLGGAHRTDSHHWPILSSSAILLLMPLLLHVLADRDALLYGLHVHLHVLPHLLHLSLEHALFHRELLHVLLLQGIGRTLGRSGSSVELGGTEFLIFQTLGMLVKRRLPVLKLGYARLHLLELGVFGLQRGHNLGVWLTGGNLLAWIGRLNCQDGSSPEVVHRVLSISRLKELSHTRARSCVGRRWR